MKRSWKVLSAVVLSATTSWAQSTALMSSEVSIKEPSALPVLGHLLTPFHTFGRVVSPARLTNSSRLDALIRGGNLYLTKQDVIALVLENNLDVAVQRYGPFLAREVLRRAQGGGFLRDVNTVIQPGPVSVSLAGVSVNTNGLASGAGVGSGGGIVIQIGPTPPNLDPYLFGYSYFGHSTTPLSNTLLSQTTALVSGVRQFQFGYGQSFITGSNVQFTYSSTRLSQNSPANLINPATSGYLDLYFTQNLLQGLSIGVNNRNIKVANNNIKVSALQFKRQVMTTVSAVLAIYWDLVSFHDDLRIKEQNVATAEKLHEDNKVRVNSGALASVELTRSAAEVSTAKEDLLISQTNVAQQETVLKNALSRNGVSNTELDEVQIVPLDHIEVPATEDLKPIPELVQQALQNRPDLEQTRINLQSSQINIRGSRNALLPSLQAFAEVTNNGLTGPVNPLYPGDQGAPDPYFVGGYGNFLGQLFRRNFPNYSAGVSLNIPFRNRQAQADYATDQLQLRQSQLLLQRAVNQIHVDVKTAVIGLNQARSRYETAVATRKLAEQTLAAEQARYQSGVSQIALVIQAQRDLAADQSAEVEATANYTHARLQFDDALGQTLAVNNVSMNEAETGRVARQSYVPENMTSDHKEVR